MEGILTEKDGVKFLLAYKQSFELIWEWGKNMAKLIIFILI